MKSLLCLHRAPFSREPSCILRVSVPMSLADACLVRMAETLHRHAICTLDGDFRVYRKDGGEAIDLVIPAAG